MEKINEEKNCTGWKRESYSDKLIYIVEGERANGVYEVDYGSTYLFYDGMIDISWENGHIEDNWKTVDRTFSRAEVQQTNMELESALNAIIKLNAEIDRLTEKTHDLETRNADALSSLEVWKDTATSANAQREESERYCNILRSYANSLIQITQTLTTLLPKSI